MQLNHPEGLIAVVLGIISFYGMTYVVIALNVGWRFGYWVAGSTFGALMVLLSLFWIVTPVGPLGEEAEWIPLAADAERISQATLEDESLSTPGRYPGSPWAPPAEDQQGQADSLSSALSNCISASEEELAEAPPSEREACSTAHGLMPPEEDIPIIDGAAVAVLPELEDIRFTTERGVQLAQAELLPITHDPRVAEDPEAGELMGEPFVMLAHFDEGAFRLPAIWSFVIFLTFTAIHLLGLHRAEQRKLSPVA